MYTNMPTPMSSTSAASAPATASRNRAEDEDEDENGKVDDLPQSPSAEYDSSGDEAIVHKWNIAGNTNRNWDTTSAPHSDTSRSMYGTTTVTVTAKLSALNTPVEFIV